MSKMMKLVGATCTATGAVVLSGLVASGAAVYSVAKGFLTAGKMIMDVWKDSNDSQKVPSGAVQTDAAASAEAVKTDDADTEVIQTENGS